MKRWQRLATGLAAVLAGAWLWHGPGGAGERFATRVETNVSTMLTIYEMQQVSARVQRSPLVRRVLLAGPADDFQRSELVRMTEQLPGVAEARWSMPRRAQLLPLPLLIEAMGLALAGFSAGFVLLYIATLRARSKRIGQ